MGGQTTYMSPLEIYYDGACPLCRREMRFAKRLDPRGVRLKFTDIAASDFGGVEVDHGTLVRTIHARRDGEMITGVEVFRAIYTRFGFGPLMWLTRLAPVAWVLEAVYARYSAWRMRRRENCADGVCDVPK